MVGSGTTCIEAKLLGRNCIGVDKNYNALILTLHRLYWLEKYLEKVASRGSLSKWLPGKVANNDISVEDMLKAKVEIYHGDARNLNEVPDNGIDLIATHPPYYNIIRYSGKSRLRGDLSAAKELEEYLAMMYQISREAFRVLKPDKYVGLLIGDTRIHKHYVPITHYVLELLLRAGFILKEEVIKIQHKMKSTRERWSNLKKRDFLLIYHEKLYILRKPESGSEYKKYKYSSYLDLSDILKSH
jgi:DNA modification methylase